MLDHLSHLDAFSRQSIALALYRMLTGHRFLISTVQDVLALTRPQFADFQHDRGYQALRLSMGERYADLPPGLHGHLVSRTLDLVTGRDLCGDDLLKNLAEAAGLPPAAAPRLQDLRSGAAEPNQFAGPVGSA